MQIPVNRRFAAATLLAGLFGLLAALPASSASASTSEGSNPLASSASDASLITPATTAGTTEFKLEHLLSSTEAEKLLSSLPIGTTTGEISPEALAKALAGLPALKELGLEHLEASLKSTLEKLTPGETLAVLQDPTSLVPNVVSAIDELLSLKELLSLGGLLGGESLSKKLESTLSKVSLSELLPGLLGSSASPQALLEELLTHLPANVVEEILHSKLSGSPVASMTVSELATDLGTTVDGLLEELDETAMQLPETTPALLAPLANGELLTALDGTNRLVFGTLDTVLHVGSGKTAEEKAAEEKAAAESKAAEEGAAEEKKTAEEKKITKEKKSGEEKKTTEEKKVTEEKKTSEEDKAASGTNGSNGSNGTDGSGSTDALTVDIPSSSSSMPATTATKKSAKKTTGKIVAVKYSVHDFIATVLVRAPGAGKLTVDNKDVSTVNRYVDGARDLSFDVVLSKAGTAAARHNRAHSLGVKLRIAFTPTNGPRSHAILKLRFR